MVKVGSYFTMLDGELLNSLVGDYLDAIAASTNKFAKKFRNLTSATALPPDSPGLQQFSATSPVKRKLEFSSGDGPAKPKKSKKSKKAKKVRIYQVSRPLIFLS